MKKIIGIVAVAAVIAIFVLTDKQADQRAWNEMFQTMETQDIKGEKVTKEIFKENKLTVVNLWMTWCPSCIEELPALEELSKEYKEKDVAFKGLIVELDRSGEKRVGLTEKEKQFAKEILNETNITFQQFVLSEPMLAGLQNVESFPITYILDENGGLVGKPVAGAHSKEEWKKIIDKRLNK